MREIHKNVGYNQEFRMMILLGGLTPQGPFGHTKVLSDRWDSRTRTTTG